MIWYEVYNTTELTVTSPLNHGVSYDYAANASLTQYITTDGGNTWSAGSACEWGSTNEASPTIGAGYTYCDPPNASGTVTGYASAPVWPPGAAVDDPDNQSYVYRVDLLLQTCGTITTSAWSTIAPPGITTLPFAPPGGINNRDVLANT